MKRLTLGVPLVVFVIWGTLSLLTGPPNIAKGSQNSTGSGTSPSASSPQSPGSPANNSANPSPAGITGGSMAIESTIFAYRALTADANKIYEAIKPKVKGQTVVIATPADFTSLVQWRTLMYQAGLLDKRALSATSKLEAILIPPFFSNVRKDVPKLGGPFIASPADVQTLIQTLASVFAVNQSLSVSAGALTSAPLTSFLAGQLRQNGIATYVPSVYAPNLLGRDNLEDTFIGKRLCQLEADRQKAVDDAQNYSQALTDAQTILSTGSSPPPAAPPVPPAPAAGPAPPISTYTAEQKAQAASFRDSYTQTINLKVAALASIVSAIDTFEATLFTGQPSSALNQGNNPPSGPAANNPPGGPAANPLPPVQGAGTNPPGATNPTGTAPTPSGPNAAGSPLQQILASDLLAHQIWGGTESPGEDILDKLHILIVQTLESGGGQLTKSNLFLGSRIYFSGGTVATFALYRIDGGLDCGGYAYAYGGYAEDDKFGKMIEKMIEKKTYPIVGSDSSCQ